jgi:hypothetical protein
MLEKMSENMETISDALHSPENFKRFFWTPDLNVYGFAENGQIIETIDHWKKVYQNQQKINN